MNIEEDEEIAIDTQAFDFGRIARPRTTVEPEHRVEQPRRDFPGDTRPLVETLRHLTEAEHVCLIPRTVALVAFNVRRHVGNGTETWYYELSFIGVV